jgi:hypothetical protein
MDQQENFHGVLITAVSAVGAHFWVQASEDFLGCRSDERKNQRDRAIQRVQSSP